jgi:protein-tyrosine kinase
MSKIYEALVRAEQERNQTDTRQAVTAVVDPPREVFPHAQDVALLPPAVKSVEEPHLQDPYIQHAYVQEPHIEEPHLDAVVQDRRAGDPQPGDINLADIQQQPWNPSIDHLPALQERGRAVEQFRSLRSRMHEFRDLNTLKAIMVSSGLPQEGKSFIAANLAIAFARHKASRVLLIDGDMRRSSLHQLLGTKGEPGLAEYLAGTAKLMDIMQNAKPLADGMPLPDGLSSLTFIGAGKDTNTAADLSGNYRFDALIKALSPHFDWIVVDSSPVNLVADGVNLARACDGVLLVARAGVTKFEVAQRALSELKASNILGYVLNAVTKPAVTGGYYGYDSYDTYDSYQTYQTKIK